MSYLIDTDIIIYSIKNNEKVRSKFLEHQHIPKSLSIVTYGELLYGAKKSKQVERNLAVVYKIRELFPVIDVDMAVMETFSDLKAKYSLKGNTIDDFDLLIAATALTTNCVLVTNNEKHFKKIEGLRMEICFLRFYLLDD
jgi:tRNA(fMet)-specific endonuclease VapC